MENSISYHRESKQNSRRYFLTVLFKRKHLIISIFIITTVLVAGITFLLPPVYEAKTTILVKFGREYIYHHEIGDQSPAISINQEEIINTEINILTSPDLVEKVIDALKVESLYPALKKATPSGMTPREAAVIAFSDQLTVQGEKRSNVIHVKFRHKDSKIAAQAVNLLVEFYKDKHLQLFSGNNSSFFDQQLETYNKKLLDSGSNLTNFKQRNKLSSLEEQRNLLLQQRADLDTNHKATLTSIEEERKRLAALNKQIERVFNNKERYTHTERDKIIVEAKTQLLNLQLMEQKLMEKYTEEHRQVRDVRQQIQLVNKYLQEQEADISGKIRTGNPVYEEAEKNIMRAEASLHSLQAKAKALQKHLSQVDDAIARLDASEENLKNLTRDVAINERNYQAYVVKREDARIAEKMNQQKMANISVIQKATPPAKPVKPKKALNIFLGIMLAAITAFGMAFLSEYARQGYLMPEDAERDLGLPVIVSVSFKAEKPAPLKPMG